MSGERSAALIDFCQGEKIKAGLIWITHSVEMAQHMEGAARQGALGLVEALLRLLLQEVHLAGRMGRDDAWPQAQTAVEKALVMVRSGVAGEAAYHLTRALSVVTGVDERAMRVLRGAGLI